MKAEIKKQQFVQMRIEGSDPTHKQSLKEVICIKIYIR